MPAPPRCSAAPRRLLVCPRKRGRTYPDCRYRGYVWGAADLATLERSWPMPCPSLPDTGRGQRPQFFATCWGRADPRPAASRAAHRLLHLDADTAGPHRLRVPPHRPGQRRGCCIWTRTPHPRNGFACLRPAPASAGAAPAGQATACACMGRGGVLGVRAWRRFCRHDPPKRCPDVTREFFCAPYGLFLTNKPPSKW